VVNSWFFVCVRGDKLVSAGADVWFLQTRESFEALDILIEGLRLVGSDPLGLLLVVVISD
jgi:hypothetical protein